MYWYSHLGVLEQRIKTEKAVRYCSRAIADGIA